MKKKTSILVLLILVCALMFVPYKIDRSRALEPESKAKATVLIEKNTKKILLEENSHTRLPIASVTKLMTILLTLEKINAGELNLTDKIVASENASGMGGSQVFLDTNAEYEVGELLKSVIIASANDSSVALAEHIAGSENNFVKMMNEKAIELNLTDTNYSNCTGLPSPNGYSSAYDQAVVLSYVLDYDVYHQYSSIWMQDFAHPSGRVTQMANTNKLSRFYEGCTGGKTGSTNEAKYCLAVGAKRNDMELISVVLGAENSKDRFKLSTDNLNYGFGLFGSKTLFSEQDLQDKVIPIKGCDKSIKLKPEKNYSIVHQKDKDINFDLKFYLPNMLTKVKENQVVGCVEIIVDGVCEAKINILSCETVEEATLLDYIKEITNS